LSYPELLHWFKLQYHEELTHADRLFNYVLDRNGEVELHTISKPELGNETPLSIFEKTLEHEQEVTQGIFKLKDIARSESDHATDVFLEWFVTEQMEEEASVRQILDQLKLVDGSPNGLFLIDRELSGRKDEGSDE